MDNIVRDWENYKPQQLEQEPVAWESLLGAVARGWCYEENANKTMDSELAVAIAKEVHALYTTPPQLNDKLEAMARECEQMPFGDTGASFAAWIRGHKL